MKRHNILLFALAICLSITCNACGFNKRAGQTDFFDNNTPPWTLKLQRVTSEKIKRDLLYINFVRNVTQGRVYCVGYMKCKVLMKERQDASYKSDSEQIFDEHKAKIKVSIKGNEGADNRVIFLKKNIHEFYSYRSDDDITDEDSFIPEDIYKFVGTTLEFSLIDLRSLSPNWKRVTMSIEILYDGKSLDNPDSKLSFYWENPIYQ